MADDAVAGYALWFKGVAVAVALTRRRRCRRVRAEGGRPWRWRSLSEDVIAGALLFDSAGRSGSAHSATTLSAGERCCSRVQAVAVALTRREIR
ncbi:hypothetical protein [Nocardia sp. NPDC058705]|uniref:hypothetical protein n=1 Tax=Nocardia sp. NPDC058705 TaxID=3346609 RepID=UPI0036B3C195